MKEMKKTSFFQEGKFWRALTNFWTAVILVFIVVNFLSYNVYDYLVVPIAVLYTGTLAIYVGTKEFERWYDDHEERHPGEWFIIVWTIVMFAVLLASFGFGEGHKMPSDVIVGVYLAVITIFAFTQKSKSLYQGKKGKRK